MISSARVRLLAPAWVAMSVVVGACASIRADDDVDIAKVVDEAFSPYDAWDRPGASVAVVRDGEIVYARGYGLANLEYGVANTPQTVFHVASVSKQFACFSVLLLEDEGRLSIEDDVRKHLPWFPDFGETITIRHLMHHTSGLRDQWELLVLSGVRMDDVITTEHIRKVIEGQRELNFAPGSEHLYSNSGYTLLALIVEAVTGSSLREFTHDRIFRPLGMARTHFHDDHGHVVPGRAYSYFPGRGGYRNAVLSFANVGATSLFTTVEDLARWLVNLETGRVGGERVRDRMREHGVLGDGRDLPYGFGIVHAERHGAELMSHNGADAGFRSYVGLLRGERLGVVVLGNRSDLLATGLGLRILDALAGGEGRARAAFDAPGAAGSPGAVTAGGAAETRASTEPASDAPAPVDLRELAGRYRSAELDTVYTLEVDEGRLVARHARHSDIRLVPREGGEFRGSEWFFRTVVFERDETGAPTGFRVSGSRVRNLLFERRTPPLRRRL